MTAGRHYQSGFLVPHTWQRWRHGSRQLQTPGWIHNLGWVEQAHKGVGEC